MKKNIIFMLLAAVMMLGGSLLAKENTILKVKVRSANVRSEPDIEAPVVAKVAAGTLLEASSQEGAWYEVTVKNQAGKKVTGYIRDSVVEVIGSGHEEEEAEAAEVKRERRAAVRRRVPQPRRTEEFAGGGVKLMGGLSLSNLKLSEPLSEDSKKVSKTGLLGGVGYESGGRIAFEMDLLFRPTGAVFKDAIDKTNKERITISGSAITMPLLLKVRFMPGTTPYVLAGGEVGYLLSQKVVVTAADGVTENEVDILEETNRLLYGLVFGGGVELQLGSMDLLLEARYHLGLSNLTKDADPGESMKASALSLLLGVRF
jgi:hypothetical protein